jgi:Zn-dependent peptidase ImmA (M78 family)/DNA-binding XRE family transcriptional regulator
MSQLTGDRVRQAREIRGFTQAELAERMSVTQATIAYLENVENYLFRPSEDLLQKLVQQLNFPHTFFSQDRGPEIPLGSLLYRKKTKLGSTEKAKLRQVARLVFELADKLAESANHPIDVFPVIEKKSPIYCAGILRSHFGIASDTPIRNITRVLENAGFWIFSLPYDIDDHDAFSVWAGKMVKPLIFTTTGKSHVRHRFNVAHELGHLIMHPTWSGTLRDLEDEANAFASEFLIPTKALLREMPGSINLGSLEPIKKRWGVSIQALIMRLFELDQITYRQKTYLFQQINKEGLRTREWDDWKGETEKACFLTSLIEKFVKPINYKKVAKLINVNEDFVKEIIKAQGKKRRGPNPLKA